MLTLFSEFSLIDLSIRGQSWPIYTSILAGFWRIPEDHIQACKSTEIWGSTYMWSSRIGGLTGNPHQYSFHFLFHFYFDGDAMNQI